MLFFNCWGSVLNLWHLLQLCLWLSCIYSTVWIQMLSSLLSQLIRSDLVVLSQSITGCKSEFERHSKEAEIKSAFPPISMKSETRHQEAGKHSHTECQTRAHTSRAVSSSYLHPDCLVGCKPTLLVIDPNFHLTPCFSVLRYSLGWAPQLKWLICCGLTGEWEGEVIYIVCGEG